MCVLCVRLFGVVCCVSLCWLFNVLFVFFCVCVVRVCVFCLFGFACGFVVVICLLLFWGVFVCLF